MNGKQQVKRYTALSKPCNPEQRAPAFEADNLAGFRIGDAVRLPGLNVTFEVIGLEDPALVLLRSPSGRTVRAGWRVLQRVKQAGGGETNTGEHA